ncbi:glycosyltransferase family 2 protein [Actinoplanes utahensis]|uniref:glycosyltransferase family 2 protein n=1 Tax=Actinoplanes utahensis TaxID=1869 RepID=UPI0007C823AA|nr:glycosyltransferase [Actinoplanes utahensis]GIF34050.1 transferase [Actinoplanes utahensis]
MTGVSIVVPTLGRPSLGALLRALGPLPDGMELLIVDDRPDRRTPLDLPPDTPARVVAGRSAGPAAARNIGWQAARHEWIAFLDDDVIPEPGWPARLVDDLRDADAEQKRVGGVQGRLWVPLPAGRRLTDWERVTAGLADGEWITADMAYRRAALARVGGFDERLPRAFREDAELAHRVRRAGWELRSGARSTAHPVRPEQRWISVRTQRGNADDALLRRLYGRSWRTVLGIPPGRRHRHAAITACLAAAVVCTGAATGLTAASRSRSRRSWFGTAASERPGAVRALSVAATLAAAGWAAGTTEFAAARIAPGPRDRREVTTMLLTSVAIPPVAIAHWLRGWFRWRGAQPLTGTPAGLTRVTPASGLAVPVGRAPRHAEPTGHTGADDHVESAGRAGVNGHSEAAGTADDAGQNDDRAAAGGPAMPARRADEAAGDAGERRTGARTGAHR